MAKQFPLDIVITATDKASAALRRVQQRLQGMGEPVRRVTRMMGEFSERVGFNRVGREALALGQNVVALGTMAAVAAGDWPPWRCKHRRPLTHGMTTPTGWA